MTREEAIEQLQNCKDLIKQDGQDYLDERDVPILDMAIEALSADRPTVDCTKFMEWLKAEVLDEENWELNAIANGEIICRKFKKLGWLDVEDGFYVDARPTGEWKQVDLLADRFCSVCGYGVWDAEAYEYNYCPNCGTRMTPYKGGDDE